MTKYILLLQLQMKTTLKELPKIIGGTILFSLLILLIGISGTKLLNHNKENDKMNIAVVLPPNGDSYTNLAFSFLSEIDTVKNVCNFNKMGKEEAFDGLRNGSIYAIILVPDNLVSHIMNGTNTPADIILPRSNINTKSMLFRTLVGAGVADISAAQAGIYAVDDVCNYYKINNGVAKAESFLNDAYFSYALNRSVYFKTEIISNAGSITQVQLYLCSGVILLLLLSGISCYELLKPENPTLSLSLKTRGIPVSILNLFKITGITVIYFLLFILTYILENLAEIRFPALKDSIANLNPGSFISLFVLIFVVFAFILFIFELSQDQMFSMLLLFILSIIMLFISGAFVPSSILPEIMRKIANFIPTTYFIRLCSEIITDKIISITIFQVLGFGVLFIMGAQILEHHRQRQL